jgi:peptidoglycan/xylan/chitin deacetylase (PgdA/CDA1 family)
MHKYFIKTPWILKQLFPHYLWNMPRDEKIIYLTFDDGPHPTITTFVLDLLKEYNATATFFCIGNNVKNYPDVYQRILNEGHAVGNHTQNHLNGWRTPTAKYLDDVAQASEVIQSNLFRPPYGKIRGPQVRYLYNAMKQLPRIIMWDVLSADFDVTVAPDQCLKYVVQHTTSGSIVVFHDSEKAYKNLEYTLPLVLKKYGGEGYQFSKLD